MVSSPSAAAFDDSGAPPCAPRSTRHAWVYLLADNVGVPDQEWRWRCPRCGSTAHVVAALGTDRQFVPGPVYEAGPGSASSRPAGPVAREHAVS